MTEAERKQWIVELSHVSEKKLIKTANDFTGPYLNGIWDFIRLLPAPISESPEYLKQLPEPKSSIGRDTIAHVKAVLGFVGDRKLRIEFEKSGILRFHEKYPNAGFDKNLCESRFKHA